MSADLYIGLMSGTSLDGIDAILVRFNANHQPEVIDKTFHPHDEETRYLIRSLVNPGEDEINRLAALDIQFGQLFANVVNTLLDKAGTRPADVMAIGCHGQTIRHFPDHQHATTLQIGDPNTIAENTGITTVADFRRRDMAAGGQGAPLVPAFHQHVFYHPEKNRVVLNLGGIANITLLPKDNSAVTGFDTGPANTLMNYWIQRQENQPYDHKGEWAQSGEVNQDCLSYFLEDPYFSLPPPKSTGTEYFSHEWLSSKLSSFPFLASEDVQATLAALTSHSIANAIREHAPDTEEVILCGGGTHNSYLVEQLGILLKGIDITSSQQYGLDPDFVEATAFAWLARQTLEKKPGNLPSVTGARRPVILGGVYFV